MDVMGIRFIAMSLYNGEAETRDILDTFVTQYLALGPK